MDQQKLDYFKKRLEDEGKLVETELKSMGVPNTQAPGGWDATPGEIDETATEPDEIADRFEEQESNQNQIDEISAHQRNIVRALAKIEAGTYGQCEISHDSIEEARLEANPSARTCTQHMHEEGNLPA